MSQSETTEQPTPAFEEWCLAYLKRRFPETWEIIVAEEPGTLIPMADVEPVFRRIEALLEALDRIWKHPVATSMAGRPDLGLEPLPSCQEIAGAAVEAFHDADV